MPPKTPTLYHRLGGRPAIEALVATFYERLLKDPALARFFEGMDMQAQRNHQVAFVTEALGGPREYLGRGMGEAHRDLGLDGRHFVAVGAHLAAALAHAGIPRDEILAVLEIVDGLRDEILGVTD